ncbi:unnamed protein product [Laminaria digitata]
MVRLWRRRCRSVLGVATAILLPPCLGFRTATTSSLCRRNGRDHTSRKRASSCSMSLSFCDEERVFTSSSCSSCSSSSRSRRRKARGLSTTRLHGQRCGKDDLMDKIGPLIESVTTSRELIPSDLTEEYGNFVFPGPLTVNERISRTLSFWGSMGRILFKYYMQERDPTATEQQWTVRDVERTRQ